MSDYEYNPEDTGPVGERRRELPAVPPARPRATPPRSRPTTRPRSSTSVAASPRSRHETTEIDLSGGWPQRLKVRRRRPRAARRGRVLGVDVGTVRVGVALSDPTGTLASPLETLRRAKICPTSTGSRRWWWNTRWRRWSWGSRCTCRVRRGLPQTDAANYAQELADRIPDVPVNLIDERLSTVTAASHLREGGIDSRKQRRSSTRRPPWSSCNSSSTAGGRARERARRSASARTALVGRRRAPPVSPRAIPRAGPPPSPDAARPSARPAGRYESPTRPRTGPLTSRRRAAGATGGFGRVNGSARPVLPIATGPVAEPGWWSYGSSDRPGGRPLSARHSGGDDAPAGRLGPVRSPSCPATRLPHHPSRPSAPLPPRPSGRLGPAASPRLRPVRAPRGA